MRGNGMYRPGKLALMAKQVAINEGASKARRRKLCWQCQKEKATTDGKLVLKPGLHMFVCKECLAANDKAKKDKLAQPDNNRLE